MTWLGTGQFQWSIGTNGTIGTNGKAPYCKIQVDEERDPDCHERLGKEWWCLRSNRKQDSTWAWVVSISAAICNALNLGFVLSFGVLFPVLLDYFNETKERTGE